MRRILLCFLLAAVPLRAAEWEVLSNCRLIHNLANDGDSFHVKHKNREYIFRLYFVDCPETDDSVSGRVDEQAAYFNITKEQALQIGATAKRFTAGKLTGSFTVTTCWLDAKGRSQLPRHFAFVTIDKNDLGELLVEQGLARIYGAHAEAPGGPVVSQEEANLLELERAAKLAHRGAWAYGAPVAPNGTHPLPVMPVPPPVVAPEPPAPPAPAAVESEYKISSTGVRHNSGCRYFNNKSNKPCGPTDGRPCKVCGG